MVDRLVCRCCGYYSIKVVRSGRRQWYRLSAGRTVLADNIPSLARLEDALGRFAPVLADFTVEA